MTEQLKQLFQSKLTDPAQAVQLVQNGDRVFVGVCTSVANVLCDALADRADDLEGLEICGAMLPAQFRLLDHRGFRVNTYFMGAKERECWRQGRADFTSVHLSQVDRWCRETAPADVAFLEVSTPDEEGYMSFGASGVALHTYVRQAAKRTILQINANVPYVFGEEIRIHISQADAVVCGNTPLMEDPGLAFSDTIQTISSYIIDQIPDGACIQLGLGGVSNAVGYGLKGKNDLGAHSELMTDSIMELMKLGVVNNSRKTWHQGQTVAAFSLGSAELYRFIDHNPQMYFMPFPLVNNPVNIAKNDNMISVNTALSIDLFGQVNADNFAGRQYSATGGQVDFVRGAQMSRGGKSFLAITSTVDNKKIGQSSRIVAQFPTGTAVTTPRSDVQYVVTEYGCVDLKPLCMRDRARALIRLAHPDFRPQLTDQARELGLR